MSSKSVEELVQQLDDALRGRRGRRADRPVRLGPPLGVVFGSCGDMPAKARRSCDWGTQYPNFWGHVIANLAYDMLAVAALVAFTLAAREEVGARRRGTTAPPPSS